MTDAADLSRAHLRVARPSDDLDAVVRFYRDGLGFSVLSGFEGHDGFNGVMLGHPGASYHLEFTRKEGHEAGRAPTQVQKRAARCGPDSRNRAASNTDRVGKT